MTTIRHKLECIRANAMWFMVVAIAVIIAGSFLSIVVKHSASLVIVLAVTFGGCLLLLKATLDLMTKIKYPKCSANLAYVVAWPLKGLYGISEKIKLCPFCGVSLDSEIE